MKRKIIAFHIILTISYSSLLHSKIVEQGQETTSEGITAANVLPKEVQRQIIKLKAQVATAEDAALDALDLAESKEKEAFALDKTIADLTKQVTEITPALTQSQKTHEEANSKETALAKDVADLKQKAADLEREAAEKSKQAAQTRKEAADKITDAAAKKQALEDAEKEKVEALKLAKEAEDKKMEATKAAELAQKQKKDADDEQEKIKAILRKQAVEQQNLANRNQEPSLLSSLKDMANKISEARDALDKIKTADDAGEKESNKADNKQPAKPQTVITNDQPQPQKIVESESPIQKSNVVVDSNKPMPPANPSKPYNDVEKPIIATQKPPTPSIIQQPTINAPAQPQLSGQDKILQLINAALSNISSIKPETLSQEVKYKQWDAAISNLNQANNVSSYAAFAANNKNALKDLHAKVTKLFVDIYKAILKTKKRAQLKLFESMTQEWVQNPLGIKIMELEKRPYPDYKKTVESLSSKLW